MSIVAIGIAGAARAGDRPERLVVKYRDAVDCASCAAAGARAPGAARPLSLELLDARLKVRGRRALFAAADRGGRSSRSARLAETRSPERAARIPADAVAPDLSRIELIEL